MADVKIFQALVAASASSPLGTLGLYQYLDRVAREIQTEALRRAPTGNLLDRLHDTRRTGTYRTSFKFDRVGGNQSVRRRRVINDARHARIVEKGRPFVLKEQRFSTALRSGEIIRVPYTSGRKGEHVLENAMKAVAGRRRELSITFGSRVT